MYNICKQKKKSNKSAVWPHLPKLQIWIWFSKLFILRDILHEMICFYLLNAIHIALSQSNQFNCFLTNSFFLARERITEIHGRRTFTLLQIFPIVLST